MFNLQCDKNFIKVLNCFFELIKIPAIISEFSIFKSDICLLRNFEDTPKNFKPNTTYLILNSDDKKLPELIKHYENKIITCGMSTRSTVTFSSIYENSGVMCLQRAIRCLNSLEISPFELPFEVGGKIIDEISILMLITSALICGADVKTLKKINL